MTHGKGDFRMPRVHNAVHWTQSHVSLASFVDKLKEH